MPPDTDSKVIEEMLNDTKLGNPGEAQAMLPAQNVEALRRGKRVSVNPRLIPAKLLMFLIHGGQSATFAFVSVHMKSLGISVPEIAVISLIIPIVTSIGPPLSGSLADRFGNYKAVLILFAVLSTSFGLCMWFLVPSFGVTLSPGFQLPPEEIRPLNFSFLLPCEFNPEAANLQEPVTVSDQSNCTLSTAQNEENDPFYGYPVAAYCTGPENDGKPRQPQLCFAVNGKVQNGGAVGYVYTAKCIEAQWLEETTALEKNGQFYCTANISKIRPLFPGSPTCSLSNHNIRPASVDQSNLPLDKATALTHCTFFYENFPVLETPFGSKVLTLCLYVLFRFLAFTASRGVFPLLDAAVLTLAKQEGGDFGVQWLFASGGSLVVPPLAGWLCGVASRYCGCPDFSPAFYLFGVMTMLGAVLVCFTDIQVTKKNTQILRTMGVVLRDPNVVSFLIAVFFCGSAWGFAIGYLFIYMENDTGFIHESPMYLLGWVNGAGYGFGIPCIYFSSKLISWFGHENLIGGILLTHAARLLIYSITYNPYLILPTEILTGFTFLAFIVPPQFAMKTAPKYIATLVGLFGAANFGLGGGMGPLVGGFLIHWFDYRPAFRIFGFGMIGIGCLYLLIYHCFLGRRNSQEVSTVKAILTEARPPTGMPEHVALVK